MRSRKSASPDFSALALFCSVDDFCEDFLPRLKVCLLPGAKRRNRARSLSESEIAKLRSSFRAMTLLIAFHQSQFRNFKAFSKERSRSLLSEFRVSSLARSLPPPRQLQSLC